MRTSNLLERLNKEIGRRTRVATIFPNQAWCLRLVSAILIETSEEVGDRARLSTRGCGVNHFYRDSVALSAVGESPGSVSRTDLRRCGSRSRERAAAYGHLECDPVRHSQR
ncbi:MAG: hypothetical protein GY811_20320 [Myxococcales bacterium]|nr:hypothetical protein [Myxococcales bacterium]